MQQDHKPATLLGANLRKDGGRRKVIKQFSQQNLGPTMFATAEPTKAMGNMHGTGSGWSLAPISELSKKEMPFDMKVLFHLPMDCGAITDREFKTRVIESLQSVLLQRKSASSGAENKKVFNRFIDCDGVMTDIPYVHRTKPAQGNDNCPEGLKLVKFMSADKSCLGREKKKK
jgi:hypothetical protein